MLLTRWRKEIFRSKCHAEHESLHCFAHLDQNIAEALPYLNAELDADSFVADPPSLTLKWYGKLVTIHADKIAVNALADEDEADRILLLLQSEINDIWERRAEITPRFKSKDRPQVFEVLRRLPRTNCRECGQPTCMVFATLVTQGAKGPEDCPPLDENGKRSLEEYLSRFSIEV